MSEVIDFRKEKLERSPHISGPASCVGCKHTWWGVAPTGTSWLTCPECQTEKGRFVHHVCRDERDHWQCNCGCQLFFITRSGNYCPNCGKWQVFR